MAPTMAWAVPRGSWVSESSVMMCARAGARRYRRPSPEMRRIADEEIVQVEQLCRACAPSIQTPWRAFEDAMPMEQEESWPYLLWPDTGPVQIVDEANREIDQRILVVFAGRLTESGKAVSRAKWRFDRLAGRELRDSCHQLATGSRSGVRVGTATAW